MGERTSQGPQVFINYRREELRHTFISHLLPYLKRKEINYFIDDNIKRGKPITELFKKIEESAIALAIFSKRYTESKWCLNELVKMKECVEYGELMVIPVFVNVKPDAVKKFTGDFGKGFKKMSKKYASKPEKVQKWKEAVWFFAGLSGLVWNDGYHNFDFLRPGDFIYGNLAMRAAEAVNKELVKRDPNHGKKEDTWASVIYCSGILGLFFGNVIPKMVFADGKLRLAASWLVGLSVFYMSFKKPVTTTPPTPS